MLGIAVMWFCSLSLQAAFLLFVSGCLLMLLGIFMFFPKILFGIGATVVMFAIGVICEGIDEREMQPRWSGYKGRFEAVLLEVPQMQGSSTKVRAEVLRIGRDSILGMRRNGIVNIYVANSVEAEGLQIGERILFEGKVEAPRNAGNPAEFDIERYCYVNGVTGTVFLRPGAWYSKGVVPLTCKMHALQLREKIVGLYERLGFSGDELSVLSALTVGDKSGLDYSLKELYATVGASHVLALSGLHLGIFYMIMTMFFPVRGRRRLFVVLRELWVVALLWCFALIAGLSPSVVRATTLFTLMSLARCMHRDVSSVNSLSFAAIVMLLYSPRYLFDISFQLSFAAVFAILLIVPWLRRLMRADNYGVFYRYLADLFAVSIAAQIGVLPFIWYFFGEFPVYFLLANPIVVPIAFVVMWLAVVMLLLMPLPFLQDCVAQLLEWLLLLQNMSLARIASLPGVSLALPHIDVAGACLLAVLLVAMMYGIMQRSCVALSLSLLLASGMGIYMYMSHDEYERPYVIFYNSNSCSAVQFVVSDDESYLLSSYPRIDVDLSYVAEPFWRREKMEHPEWLSDGFSNANISCLDGMVCFSGRRVKMLFDDCWREEETVQPVDCIYLCRGFLGPVRELLSVYPTRCVIMDATLYAGSRRRIARECAEAGIRCIDIETDGAMMLSCSESSVNLLPMRDR